MEFLGDFVRIWHQTWLPVDQSVEKDFGNFMLKRSSLSHVNANVHAALRLRSNFIVTIFYHTKSTFSWILYQSSNQFTEEAVIITLKNKHHLNDEMLVSFVKSVIPFWLDFYDVMMRALISSCNLDEKIAYFGWSRLDVSKVCIMEKSRTI